VDAAVGQNVQIYLHFQIALFCRESTTVKVKLCCTLFAQTRKFEIFNHFLVGR
jgi:hypothetical protein